ncbi:streptococcal hemagglutinin-like [Procambarus clarkii]|uniref:streptococcal hemagglutinin-like n=1 Tax=Procambarus clarkii TaxID=6728 RepID=UPI0037447AEC
MYADNGLPTFTVRDELFTTTASANTNATNSATNTTSASNINITISSTAMADILSADAHPVQPATDSATSLHTATTPDEPSTSPVVPETAPTSPASPENTPAAPETTPASQVPTPDASANQYLFSDDDSTASIDVEAQSPSPATVESPRVSALYDQREKLTLGTPEYRRLSSKILNTSCPHFKARPNGHLLLYYSDSDSESCKVEVMGGDKHVVDGVTAIERAVLNQRVAGGRGLTTPQFTQGMLQSYGQSLAQGSVVKSKILRARVTVSGSALAEMCRELVGLRGATGVPSTTWAGRSVPTARSDEVTISALLQGRVGGITFSKADSPERSRRYREYLVTSYPHDLDISHAKELPGVYSARRIKSGGKPLNRIVIVWKHETPPPSHHTFLGPYRPACPITRWESSAVMCFKCQHFGHVAKHCQSSGTCAFCAANHLTKECPNKDHAPGTDETSSSATKHKCSSDVSVDPSQASIDPLSSAISADTSRASLDASSSAVSVDPSQASIDPLSSAISVDTSRASLDASSSAVSTAVSSETYENPCILDVFNKLIQELIQNNTACVSTIPDEHKMIVNDRKNTGNQLSLKQVKELFDINDGEQLAFVSNSLQLVNLINTYLRQVHEHHYPRPIHS